MLFALFVPFLKKVNTAIQLTCEEEAPCHSVKDSGCNLDEYLTVHRR